jgi:hypothetical protein
MRWIEICLQVGALACLPEWIWFASHSSADDSGQFGPVYMAIEMERGIVRYISTYTRREIPHYNRSAV